MAPALVTFIDGEEWTRVTAPPLGARAWNLGIVAVQVTVESGHAVGQLRAHATLAPAPEVRPIVAPTLIQVQLVPEGENPLVPPPLTLPELAGAAARLQLWLDEESVASVELPPASAEGTRAFAHVFCRWLRSGAFEAGFDLTDFLLLPPGKMYQRKIIRTLQPGETVSFALDLGH